MMKRQDETREKVDGDGKDVVFLENQVVPPKVGIFSARTPNRFVGFFLVVEGELELGLSITARSVGRSYIIVDTVDIVILGRITFHSTVDFFGLSPYYYLLLLLLTRGGGN